MEGWIKIHRQITDNPIWKDKPFAEGQAWIDLLIAVTYDRSFIKVKNGTRIELRRGECGYSTQTLAERWGWSRGKVKRFLNYLENDEKMIQQKIVSNTTIIKVLNYSFFQNDTINDTINGQQTIQQTDTIKKDKKDKKDKNTHTMGVGDYQNLSSDDLQVLRNYAKKSKANNVDAYVHTLVRSGSYKRILEEYEAKQKRKVEQTNAPTEVVKSTPEEDEEARRRYLELTKDVRMRRK